MADDDVVSAQSLWRERMAELGRSASRTMEAWSKAQWQRRTPAAVVVEWVGAYPKLRCRCGVLLAPDGAGIALCACGVICYGFPWPPASPYAYTGPVRVDGTPVDSSLTNHGETASQADDGLDVAALARVIAEEIAAGAHSERIAKRLCREFGGTVVPQLS